MRFKSMDRLTRNPAPLPHVPRLPAELIALIEPLIGRPRGWTPKRLSRERLLSIREQLRWVAAEFGGEDSLVYRRALLVVALEYSRAEVLPDEEAAAYTGCRS
jgi:hypothetical protein